MTIFGGHIETRIACHNGGHDRIYNFTGVSKIAETASSSMTFCHCMDAYLLPGVPVSYEYRHLIEFVLRIPAYLLKTV